MQLCSGQSQEKASRQTPWDLVLVTLPLVGMSEGWPPSDQYLGLWWVKDTEAVSSDGCEAI